MKSLGKQFEDIMMPRVQPKRFSSVAQEVADVIVDDAKQRTRRGETVKGGVWKRGYSESYRRKTGKSAPVDLRKTGSSMQSLRGVSGSGNRGQSARAESSTKTSDGENILRVHDKGLGRNNPRRQIFPETHSQMPTPVFNKIRTEVKKVLSGVS